MATESAYELDTLIIQTANANMKKELSTVFANEPYQIGIVNNSFRLLQSILRRQVLVCIYDVGRGRKEKLETIPVIIRVKPDISLIVLSGIKTEKIVKRIHQNRLYYFFDKPVDYEELLIAVRSAFEFHRQRIHTRGW